MSDRSPRFRTALILSLVGLTVLVAGAVGFVRWNARRAPQHALVAIANAVHDRDTAAVERAVDLTSLSKQVVDEAIATMKVQSLRSDGASTLGVAAGGEMLDKMAPTVARSFEMSLHQSLNRMADSATDHTPVILEPLVRLAQALGGGLPVYGEKTEKSQLAAARAGDGVEWLGFGETHWRGDTALVPLRVRDRDLPKPVTITTRLLERDGVWTLIALDRVGDVLVDIQDQRKAIVDAYNKNLVAELRSMITLEGPIRRRVSNPDGYGIRNWVIIGAPVTNRSGAIIRSLALAPHTGDDRVDEEVRLTREAGSQRVPLRPGETAVYDYYLDYNQFIDWHDKVRYGTFSPEQFEPVLMIRETKAGAVDTLIQLDGWLQYAHRVLKRY